MLVCICLGVWAVSLVITSGCHFGVHRRQRRLPATEKVSDLFVDIAHKENEIQ